MEALTSILREVRDPRDVNSRHRVPSMLLAPSRVLDVIRAHWSIANDLHWQLDVVFHEDDARARKNYGPQNLAVIRRIARDMLRTHPLDARSPEK